MKGTTKKNFGKSGRSGAVLTLAGLFIMTMALVFGFAACETEEEAKATKFEGTWTQTYYSDASASVCVFEKDVVKFYILGSDYLDGDVANYRGTFEFTDTTLTLNFTEGKWGADEYYDLISTVVMTFTYVLEGDTVTLTATGSTSSLYAGTYVRRIPNAD
jgi:hypothetical protein